VGHLLAVVRMGPTRVVRGAACERQCQNKNLCGG
jgi:hypothetical protein